MVPSNSSWSIGLPTKASAPACRLAASDVSPGLADIATGSFFVETIYQVPGVGRYFVQSISGRDYPVILGTVLLLGLVVSVMNLIVDLLYPLLDPRIGRR